MDEMLVMRLQPVVDLAPRTQCLFLVFTCPISSIHAVGLVLYVMEITVEYV